MIIFILLVILLPVALMIYDTHTDPYWIKYNKDREEAFKRYGEYPPEVYVDFWGNRHIDPEKTIRWLIKTGQFKENLLKSQNNLKFEWVKDD